MEPPFRFPEAVRLWTPSAFLKKSLAKNFIEKLRFSYFLTCFKTTSHFQKETEFPSKFLWLLSFQGK